MNLATVTENTFLLELFREFYAELSDLKARVLSGRGMAPEQVFYQLRDSLQRKELDAGRRLEVESEGRLFRETLYVMAVLADETFLNINWAGREAWRGMLLENEFFHTCIAGDELFEKVEAVLQQRDGANIEMGILYLYALSLGFRGRYRDGRAEEPPEIAVYRRKLYVMVSGRRPELFEQRELFPGTLVEAVSEAPRNPLPDIRKWLVIAGSVVLVYIMVSHAIWYANTADLFRLTNCVLKPEECQAVSFPDEGPNTN